MSQAAGGPLKAVGIDFLRKKNVCLHHTYDYENTNLIVRRGKEFTVKLTFNREVHDKDKVILQLSIGEKPMKSNGTFLRLNVRCGQNDQPWHANICETDGNECLIAVTSPADAIIGKYLVKVDTGHNVYNPDKFFYLLFNPWCEADTVFMPDDDERTEYVMNDTGYIYVGSTKNIRGRPWNFGQFEKDILDCCMYLLDKSQLKPNARKDPVIISRAMSALCVLDLCLPFMNTFGFPEMVMRCLGVPARSVTNFASAHDTEENLKVDVFLNENGEKLDHLTTDSVWNFHVWNDVWMKRPDLPKGFDGWQAIDATPQEKSQGIFQCGPTPISAIKKGEVYLPYDSKFVFAEVNADKVFWLVKKKDGKEKYIRLREETKVIGKSISTKAVGKNVREDITDQYKYPEESPEERKAVKTACYYLQSCNLGTLADQSSRESLKADLKFGIEGDETVCPGQPIDLKIFIKNESLGAWTIDFIASCQLESYTGNVEANLASMKQTIQTEGKPDIEIPLKISADAYIKTLMDVEDELLFKINIIAEVQETNEKFMEEVMLNFQYPKLKVEMADTAKVNEDFTCAFIFKNTLSIPLEKCKLHVEGLGLFTMETFDQGNIAPGGIFKCKIVCAPRKTGLKKIVAKLTSTQIKGITEEKVICITK
ncbi:protein-glutamine gamma-glutamyltransferase 4-like [Sceloporus undulatus]|uniref:protein-glutamine gamma-glutamyltransferase 4-like n=1 Tax=Sceloporus undulatus TaxID=8520 RepID=UPI001C4D1ABA|nr:protein-glutamine gamma-glutamyltransferase 4-like [Sceloporus undulatus]